ncbi:MAG: 30S ribosomal protein S16 [Deltaproteobacteria bacterium]|nr:30S ribosomal protein S16 [Deltaproteobacteria bacterium]
MAVKLRLARGGSKGKPFYRVVVSDETFRRDGRVCEKIGYYNPIPSTPEIELKMDRVEHWLSNGALPTKTVQKIIRVYKERVSGK